MPILLLPQSSPSVVPVKGLFSQVVQKVAVIPFRAGR